MLEFARYWEQGQFSNLEFKAGMKQGGTHSESRQWHRAGKIIDRLTNFLRLTPCLGPIHNGIVPAVLVTPITKI
jgi:hypothetical protein